MSKYTTEVRFICEVANGLHESKGCNDVDSIIKKALPSVFNFDFPMFDEHYRNVLETKIIKHFYTKEIGFETVGLWKLKLNTKLNEIMPYYNKLYESELLTFEPFKDVNYTVTRKGTKSGKEIGEEKVNENNRGTLNKNGSSNNYNEIHNAESTTGSQGATELFSDTPQGALTGIENMNYLTNATKNNGTSESVSSDDTNETTTKSYKNDDVITNDTTNNKTRSNSIDNTEDYVETYLGKQNTVSYSNLLKEFRTTFLNIDMLVIEELNDLFMNLW